MKREFVLGEAEAMVPLIRHILCEVTEHYSRLQHMNRKVRLLHDCRRSTKYQIRRQYHAAIRDQRVAEEQLQEAVSELDELGVVLLDPVQGVAGLPFLWSLTTDAKSIRPAYFLLKLVDDPERGIRSWRFETEEREHRIPAHWRTPVESASGRSQ